MVLSAPYPITDCEVLTHNYGDWKPSRAQVVAVGQNIATDVCYGYWEVDPRRLGASIEACSTDSNSATVKFVVPFQTATGAGGTTNFTDQSPGMAEGGFGFAHGISETRSSVSRLTLLRSVRSH